MTDAIAVFPLIIAMFMMVTFGAKTIGIVRFLTIAAVVALIATMMSTPRHAPLMLGETMTNDQAEATRRTSTWYFDAVNAADAHALGYTGQGVVVAVLDTGYAAEDAGADWLLPGYDFIIDPTRANDGDGRDSNPVDSGDYCSTTDRGPTNHGPRMMDIVREIAPGAKIMPVRVIGACGGTMDDVVAGIRWAADNGAHIISMSFGGDFGYCPSPLSGAVLYAAQSPRGAALFAAAGNGSGAAGSHAPAACLYAHAVMAANENGNRTGYSNWINNGMSGGVMAPGGDRSHPIVNSYGTSQATAISSGIAALMMSAKPAWMRQGWNIRPAMASAMPTTNRKNGTKMIDALLCVQQALR
jgi:subtilisin family serine protease